MPPSAKTVKKPIALQLYSVRREAEKDYPGTLKRTAGIGYAGVELAGTQGRTLAEVNRIIRDLGMAVSSYHSSLVTKDTLQQMLDDTALLGCTVVVSGWKREDWDSLEGIRRAAEAFQRSAELLKPHGLLLACHNHWWELKDFGGTRGLEHFFALAPDAHAELDVYWAARFGEVDVPAFARKWRRRVPLMHVKDGPLVEGLPHTAVGEGKMDIPAVVRAADPSFLQWLIVELDECGTDMFQAVEDSYRYLISTGLGVGRQ